MASLRLGPGASLRAFNIFECMFLSHLHSLTSMPTRYVFNAAGPVADRRVSVRHRRFHLEVYVRLRERDFNAARRASASWMAMPSSLLIRGVSSTRHQTRSWKASALSWKFVKYACGSGSDITSACARAVSSRSAEHLVRVGAVGDADLEVDRARAVREGPVHEPLRRSAKRWARSRRAPSKVRIVLERIPIRFTSPCSGPTRSCRRSAPVARTGGSALTRSCSPRSAGRSRCRRRARAGQ